MYAEIIAIGDEITSGQTLDTNSQWLSQRLEESGIAVLYHSTVGDELRPCVDVFRCAMARADVIVATGGLGPTADDLTRDALSEAAGRPLRLDAAVLADIQAMFLRRQRPMPDQNRVQAAFPEGSRVVRNPHGTAPGIDLEIPREGRQPCRVICLPGVPAEMKEMWHDSVAEIIAHLANGGRLVRRRRIHCFGAGESQIEAMLPDLIRRGRQPTVGITASQATISLRIAAEGATEQECSAAMETTVATIYKCLGPLIFGEEDDELQHVVLRMLQERGHALATLECATAGLLAERLGSVADAAKAYRGGMILPQAGEPVDAMAAHCLKQFSADYGLAVGPVLPSVRDAEKRAGQGGEAVLPTTVTLALASASGVRLEEIPLGVHPALERVYIAKRAMNLLRLALLEK